MAYISHARTLSELQAEVVNYIRLRIESLRMQRDVHARGAAGRARFDGRINELEQMLTFWSELELVHSKVAKAKEA